VNRLVPRTLVLLSLCAVVAGCGRMERLPTAVTPERGGAPSASTRAQPVMDSARGFYPLAVGNRWVYAGWSSRTRIVAGRDTLVTRTTWTRKDEIVGREVLAGCEYFRIETARTQDTLMLHNVSWLRQGHEGLYSSCDAPGTAQEQTVLEYPLHPGASWALSPAITERVEAREVLDTPVGRFPAWRIRWDLDGGGVMRLWIGACGIAGTVTTTRIEQIDPDAGLIVYASRSEEWLTSVRLVQGRALEGTAARSE
jgi:hypothetical protein